MHFCTSSEPVLPPEQERRTDLLFAGATFGALVLVFSLLLLFSGAALPILVSVAIAYVLNPLVVALERRGIGRSIGTALVFFTALLLFAGLLVYVIPGIAAESQKLPDLFRLASSEIVPRLEKLLGASLPQIVKERTAQMGDQAASLLQSAGPVLLAIAASFAGSTAHLVSTLLGLLVIPVLTFYFLRDYPRIIAKLESLLPRRAAPLLAMRFAEVDLVLSAFARGQLALAASLAILYAIGLSIAHLDLAVVIAVIAGFANVVPYVGTVIGVVLTGLSLLVSWQGPWQIIAIVVTFVGAQILESLVLTPRLVGKKVGLSPLVVILAILAFGELFGFLGILLAVPASAVLKVVLRVVVERWKKSEAYAA